MKTTVPENLAAALRLTGIYPFQSHSCHADYDAERNLRGRTHYVDADTLKGFQARILDSGLYAKGVPGWECSDALIFWIVESVNSRPDHKGKNKRFVAFDVFGTVINDRASLSGEPEAGWHRNTEAARKEGLAGLAGFNAVKHTRDTLANRARKSIAAARETLAALKTRKSATT